MDAERFDSHTNLHHSQTLYGITRLSASLTPILIYIILKLPHGVQELLCRLTPILIYIILKLPHGVQELLCRLTPILIYIILKQADSLYFDFAV